VITIEEHQAAGGFGSAVAEVLADEQPTLMKRMGLQDEFGQSGEADELMEHYGLTAPHIVKTVKEMLGA